jgi:hypothetical protein
MIMAVVGIGYTHEVRRAGRASNQTLCVHNLKMLASALKIYAQDHGGKYPDRISELVPQYITNVSFLVCPEQGHTYQKTHEAPYPLTLQTPPEQIDALSSYRLLPGRSVRDAVDMVAAYEVGDNHFGKGRSVLYMDGHGAWEPPDKWRGGPANPNLPAPLVEDSMKR